MDDFIATEAPRRGSVDAVLQFAWNAGVFTSSDALAAVRLTRSTTIEAIDDLIALELVRELPNARAVGEYRKGRPARRFQLRADAGVVVGVDAGREHVTTKVADLRGTILASQSRETGTPPPHAADAAAPRPAVGESADERRRLISDAVDAALAAAGRSRREVIAVCAGVPAPVDAAGASPAKRDDFWRRMNPDLAGLFAEWVPIVRVENDASLAAVAEGSVGAAVGCRNYVTLLAGARLGAGVVIDGHLLRGAHGGAGEMVAFDHVVGVGEVGGVGYRLGEWAREALASGDIGPQHPLALLPTHEVTARVVLELAHAGDAAATALVQRAALLVARIVGTFGSFYDPERVVISGAVADGIDDVLAAARTLLPAELDLPAPDLVASRLGGEVVAIGAVSAAVEVARGGLLALTAARRASE